MSPVIKADNSDATSPAGGKVSLTLADLASEARRTIQSARDEASRLIAEAKQQADEERHRGFQRGYEEGYASAQADGHQEGKRSAEKKVAEEFRSRQEKLLNAIEAVASDLAAHRGDLRHQAEQELLRFSLELAERIVGRIAAQNIDTAQANLRKVLEKAVTAGDVTVRVNPEQLPQLTEHAEGLARVLGVLGTVTLAGDETVAPGGARLDSRHGQIDATVRAQLDNIAAVLLGEDETLLT